jgi:retron-type reverse transcriptase
MLNKIMIRNLIRLAGIALSYWSFHINGHVDWWLVSCVQDINQENTNAAFQKEGIKAQRSKINGLKNRNNLRTPGFNLFGGKRSICSTLDTGEGIQTDTLFVCYCRSFSTKILSINLDERVLITELKQQIEKCKNKDGRYGNLIQIIGSPFTLKVSYLMIKSNSRILAKGVDDEALNGINWKSIEKMSTDILCGNHKILPVRRVLISKPGKDELHSLGVRSPREKIVRKALEMVLMIIYEDVFLDCCHGFRLGRSCHTALKYLQLGISNPSSYMWVIEGDIKSCFENIPHKIILKGLRRKVDCPATLILVKKILNAGYVLSSELKKRGPKAKIYRSNVGIPLNIVLSPLFCNIVLHELDSFIEKNLGIEYYMGKKRKTNLKYCKFRYQIKYVNVLKKRRKLINKCLKMPFKDFHDVNFKRLYYVRYVDNWVILLAGSYDDAIVVRSKIFDKLQRLGLMLNLKKTQITSLRNDKSRFLGVDFFIRKNPDNYYKSVRLMKKNNTIIWQKIVPRLIFHAPILKLLIILKEKGFVKRNSNGEFFPLGKTNCIPLTHPQILNYFNSKIREILNYYSCVDNRMRLWSIVRFLHYSCALTLARKFKLKTLKKTFNKFGRNLKFVNKEGKKYEIFRPKNLQMLPINKRFYIRENNNIDKLLNQTWSNSMTFSQFDESCAICDTIKNMEIHRIKSIRNVRVKT